MAYFLDLSACYSRWHCPPNLFHVGWLESSYVFETANISEEIVAKLWNFCEWSIWERRGFHVCDLPGCEHREFSDGPFLASRGDTTLKLGAAEILVFGNDGKIYAAPNLIYHYVTAHQYKMPDEFVMALKESPDPQNPEYFDRLKALDLEWVKTLRLGGRY